MTPALDPAALTKAKNHSISGDPPSILHAEERWLEQHHSARRAHLGGDHAEDDSIG